MLYLIDVQMMAMFGEACERSEAEFIDMLARKRLRLPAVDSLQYYLCRFSDKHLFTNVVEEEFCEVRGSKRPGVDAG